MQPWVSWLIAAVLLFGLEVLTPGGFFFVCFAGGAMAAALMTFFAVPWWAPWVVFLFASSGLIIISRPIARKLTDHASVPSNIDAYTGKRAIVTKTIDPTHTIGMVSVEGDAWRATTADQSIIAAGAWVVIQGVDGTKLVVKPE